MSVRVFAFLTLYIVAVFGQHHDNCRNWCRDRRGSLVCCEHLGNTQRPPIVDLNACRLLPWLCNNQRKCPDDHRPLYDCDRPQGGAAAHPGHISGTQECYNNSECGGRALCCWDSCLGYRKCTNV
ncbi:uncharacterized protein [Macrobrachium rosenbergii]|uniref:uncharacterized protein isoform X1 n=1 Tax=Macrobrachium rosenbergii TaxID=79674 RepID=UPI0034D6F37E